MEPLCDGDPTGVGEYRLLGVLGSGGMGRVYLGGDSTGKLAAVKVVHDGLAEEPGFRVRFAREVEAATRVSAAGVSDVLAGDTEADRPWLATEFVPGPSLEQAIEHGGAFEADQVAVLAAGLATALAGLHAAGLIHRDLKPSNVMLGPDGPRLIDFGIVRAADATRITHTGLLLGTPGYMSPEQAGDDTVGSASDVFSLASVLVFAATGRGPFGETANPVAMLLRIARDEPELGGIAEQLRPVLARCLAKAPADRPTAAELAAELSVTEEQRAGWPPPVVRERTEQLAAVVSAAVRAPVTEPEPPQPDRTGVVDRVAAPESEPTRAVRTIVVPARSPRRRRGNRVLWFGLGAAVVAAVGIGVAARSAVIPAVGAKKLDTPAAISAAIDEQVREAGTLRGTGTVAPAGSTATVVYQTQLRIDGEQIWYSITGRTDLGPDPRTGTQTRPAGPVQLGMVVLPGHLWLYLPPTMAVDSTKPPWTEYSLDSTSAKDKIITDRAEKLSWQYLNPLRSAARAATLVGSGSEELDGTATTRYTLRVDPAAVAQLAQDPNWQPTTPVSSDPATTGTFTLWLDDRNRLVRFRSQLPSGSEWTNLPDQDVRFSGWGEPVRIDPPPPDQVAPSTG